MTIQADPASRPEDTARTVLDIYVDSCRNESWADHRGLQRAGRAERVRAYPARVSRLLPLIRSDLTLAALGWIINLCWPLLAPAFFLLKAMQWGRQAGRDGKAIPVREGARLWLFFSDRFAALSPALLEELHPDLVVMGPQDAATQRFPGVPRFPVRAGTRRGDVAAAYGLALRGVWCVVRDLGIRQSSQSYTAFEWFMTARILERLVKESRPSELVFLNHYDRWAILFDALPSPPRHVLVQHGILYRDAPTPVTMRRLDTIYVYSPDSAERFTRNVLAAACRPQFHQQPAGLSFSEPAREPSSRFRILLVGDPMQAAHDVAIGMAILTLGLDLELVVKPHPRFPHAPYVKLKDKGARLVLETDGFPRADLAICGMSTLGVQYETAGCPVIWYEDFSAADVAEQVRAAMTGPKRQSHSI